MEQKIDNSLLCVIEARNYFEDNEEFPCTDAELTAAEKSPTGFIKIHNGINLFVTKRSNVNIS